MEIFIKKSWREPLNSVGLLLLRVSIGIFIVAFHGWKKLANFSALKDTFQDPIGLGSQLSLTLAVGAEVFGGILLIVGLATRIVSIPLLFTMLVAAFVVHSGDPWAKQEFALIYAFAFATLIFTGPGRFSLDTILDKRRKKRN